MLYAGLEKIIRYFTLGKVLSRLYTIKRRVYKKVGTLSAEFAYSREPVPFKEKDALTYLPIKTGRKWSRHEFGCAWFHFKGKVPETSKGKHVAFLISLGAEGCVIDSEGTPVQGLANFNAFIETQQPSYGKRYVEFKKSADGGEEIDLWVEAGNNKMMPAVSKNATFKEADIVEVEDGVKSLFYDSLALSMELAAIKDIKKRQSIRSSLRKASAAYSGFPPDGVTAAREILKKETESGEDVPFTVYATGHSHLDLAWLWPIRETQRKAGRTFANQLRNIERYPGFVYGASQPQQFEWVEKKYPKLFEQIKKAVADGRIEPQGGMWVECDTNITSGEALIRQCLYGKRFWKEKFGKDSKICWLPDVFGFSGNLPQIIKKCGMDYFLTIKLSWNEHNKFPKKSFIWEGIDDSRVLVHMPPEGNYNSDCSPISLETGLDMYSEKDVSKVYGLLYGCGDGGGGPGEGHVELAAREGNMKGLPKVVMSPASDFFAALEKERDRFDVFKGELYLEKHQGTYTTQGRNKFFNRKTEFLLHNVEFLYSLAGGLAEYPREALDRIWKEVLLYQFHDIIPGSSIARVYKESVARYEKLTEELNSLEDKAITVLGAGKLPSAFNATGYGFKGLLRSGGKTYSAEIPPYGASTLKEYKDSGAAKAAAETLENDLYILTFGKGGEIVKLFDKKLNKDFVGKYLNKLAVYRDKRLYFNAWDIDINYTKHKRGEFKLIGSSFSSGDGIAERENIYKYGKSTITQKIILTEGSPVIEFSTAADWQETHRMLRAEFRPSVFSDEAAFDIQMGNLKRSTKNETSIEKAQFEVSAHKWVDVSDKDAGFSILTDCKYGWRIKEGKLSLNLLRSPMYPAKDADKGAHTIRYGLYPHSGGVFEAGTRREAYFFNNPPIVTDLEINLPSLVSSNRDNIVIETVKPAESGQGIAIRAYEDSGKETTVKITFGKDFSEAIETDMLENKIKKANLSSVKFRPYEIKTFVIK